MSDSPKPPFPNEHPAVSAFVLAVQACSNGDPIFLVSPLEPRESDAAHGLARLLENGTVDRAIKQADAAYQWLNYSEFGDDLKFHLCPGTFVSKTQGLAFQALTHDELVDTWRWLLNHRGVYFSEESLPRDPERVLQDFLSALTGTGAEPGLLEDWDAWTFWRVKPDFLFADDDSTDIAPGKLAYFESLGHNLALFGLGPGQGFLFLLNTYPGYHGRPDILGSW